MPIRFSYGGSQEEGAVLNRPIEGIVTEDSDWGNTTREYKNLNLVFECLQCTTYILDR